MINELLIRENVDLNAGLLKLFCEKINKKKVPEKYIIKPTTIQKLGIE